MLVQQKNNWTGGQYSIFRAIFGIYLLVHFLSLLPWAAETFSSVGVLPDKFLSPLIILFPNLLLLNDSPTLVAILISSASLASLCFTFGFRDKLCAFFMWYTLACLFGRNPLTANPSLPFVGWILLAHCLIPAAPLLSISAKDKDLAQLTTWYFPQTLFVCSWILMATSYSYSGVIKLFSPSWIDGSAFYEVLKNPLARPSLIQETLLHFPLFFFKIFTWGALALEVLYAPLSLFKNIRPVIWFVMFTMHLGLIVLVQFADLSFGMIILHLFTFNPRWISAKKIKDQLILFYDGSCGLCHRWVKLVLSEDLAQTFSFSPLQGDTLSKLISKEERVNLPDSLVIYKSGSQLLTKSSAVILILDHLGGYWRILAILSRIIPKVIRDLVYDFIAAIRYRVYPKEKEVCPLLPPEFRDRFLA